MPNLTRLGVNGLLGVNSWLGVINSNLQGASRTGYKTVRPVLLDSGGTITQRLGISIPQATLSVEATTFEWAQGSITNSTSDTHFALQGQGFFVVTDTEGKVYLTRDGEFHWDNQGYLVNSAGLRVMSAGQDFIRIDGAEIELFNSDGSSQGLKHYGNKSFMIVDVANRQGLTYSKYGSTVFELGGQLPLRVQNDFRLTADGLTFNYTDPKQRTYVDQTRPAGFIQLNALDPNESDFSIDFGFHGRFDWFAQVGAAFDPTVHTINDVVTQVNAWAAANNLDINVRFDPDGDRLYIRNIPEPKILDPGLGVGNFAIDFGANGFFTYHGFDPSHTTIGSIIQEINNFGNGNIVAAFNPATGTFSLTNTTGAGQDNRIVFDGINGGAIANLFQLPDATGSTGGGANATISATPPIDRRLLTANPSAQITANDVISTTLNQLISPLSNVQFQGPNGDHLAQFFNFSPPIRSGAVSATSGFSGQEFESRGDIDNSNLLNSPVAGEHDLDILAADVATKTFQEYVTTTDTTYPGFDFSGPPATYFHNTTARSVNSIAGAAGHGLIGIGNAQVTDEFDLVLDYLTDSPIVEFHFGFSRAESIDTRGLSLYYETTTGNVSLFQRSENPVEPPIQIGATQPGQPNTSGLGGTPHRMAIKLDGNGVLTFGIDGAPTANFNLFSGGTSITGHLAIGHQTNTLEIHNLYADFKAFQNADATGQVVSLSRTGYAGKNITGTDYKSQAPNIVQNALENSTASLTEYLPLMAQAQKVFASISKIITASNAMTDDVNSLIR